MKILISAAEASSDIHGAALLRALRTEVGDNPDDRGGKVDAFGVGGPSLQAAGLRAVIDARGLLSMGFFEIAGKIPRFLRALKELEQAAERERPDVAVVIDYPDFHFRLARRLKAMGIPVIYYIPPKVWVWRRKRVAVLRERFARVLSIFPFEAEFLQKESVPVVYVGNPLVDELPLALSREAARAKLGIAGASAAPVITMLPGSRPSELAHHLGLMLDALALVAAQLRAMDQLASGVRLRVLIPLSASTDPKPIEDGVREWQKKNDEALEVSVHAGTEASAHALIAADAGIVKSGTSTLEAGVLLCPHVVVYRPNVVSSWIFRNLIRYRGPVGLVNLVGGYFQRRREEAPVRELLMEDVTPKAIADEVVALLTNAVYRTRMLDYLRTVRAALLPAGEAPAGQAPTTVAPAVGPSRLAAREVLNVVAQKNSAKTSTGVAR